MVVGLIPWKIVNPFRSDISIFTPLGLVFTVNGHLLLLTMEAQLDNSRMITMKDSAFVNNFIVLNLFTNPTRKAFRFCCFIFHKNRNKIDTHILSIKIISTILFSNGKQNAIFDCYSFKFQLEEGNSKRKSNIKTKMEKGKSFWRKYGLYFLGVLVGGLGGYSYWSFIGCSSGTCPITSSPLMSTLWGAVIGGGLFSMFKVTNKK